MSNHESDRNQDSHLQHGGSEQKQATIILDNDPTKILAGTYSLADFKEELHIDQSKVVEQFIKGKFETLSDTNPIDVKGGEKFATHVPRGGSSCK